MAYMIRAGLEAKYQNMTNLADHAHFGERRVHSSIINFVGNTPLVKLNKIPEDYQLACEIYVKCEFINPGGSIKDRIVQTMIADATSKGIVHRDSVFVEPTSGNTGIGIAFACTLNGHKSVIVTSEKNSDEKINTLRLLGAKVIQTKTAAQEMEIAQKIKDSDPKYVMLNQFANRVNPHTHYDTTAKEILEVLPQVDMFVAGAGTGGTVSGAGHRLKEYFPDCIVVSPEPDGSTMILHNRKRHPFLVEGIGGTNPNPVFDEKIVDDAEVITDEESFLMARDMSRKEGILCDVKCEFINPGGSIKDRIVQTMIADATSKGIVHRDSVFVEPTSGNTGIGIAFACTLNGHKSVIVTSEKNSDEKINTLRLLGAKVIQTKTAAQEMEIAQKIKDSDPKYVMLNQFANRVNPHTHYDTTAKEILEVLPQVDMFVAGAGTGGTVSGAGHRLKEYFPDCIVVSPEPDGSTMILHNRKRHPFLVEGIGGTNPNPVFDEKIVDDAEVITDEESFLMARDMSRKEGILCGGSSGCAMMAAVKAAKKYNFGAGKKIVVILPDGIRNYMSKFVNDQWMEAYLFLDPPKHTMRWWNLPITELKLKHRLLLIDEGFTCSQAVVRMNHKGVNVGVVIDDKGRFVGAVSKEGFRYSATNPTKLPGLGSEEMDFEDPVTLHLVKHCYKLARNGKKGMPTIGRLSRVLDITPFVVIGLQKFDEDQNEYFIPDAVATSEEVFNNIYTFSPHS